MLLAWLVPELDEEPLEGKYGSECAIDNEDFIGLRIY